VSVGGGRRGRCRFLVGALALAGAAAFGGAGAPARAQTAAPPPEAATLPAEAGAPPAPAPLPAAVPPAADGPPADAPDVDVEPDDVDVVEPDDGGDESDAQRFADLEQRLADTQQLLQRRRPLVTVGGYVDFGFFAVSGDGTGFVQDEGPNRRFPGYASQYSWVFLGDLLAPAVNSRGEPASLGNAPGVDRTDSVNSTGAPSFIVNEVNLTLNAAVADSALATASMDFLPRSGTAFSLGDAFEVDLAQLEWMPGLERRTSIFVGKMESVLGIEYRDRKSNQRFGVTPSLIARYTTGTPLGVKVRSKLGAGDWLVLAGAVTNGSSTIEQFHFYDEIDSNAGKTLSGRVSVAPVPALELGVSGEYGAQDHALDSSGALWFFGADAQAHLGRLELKGEWLIGRGAGEGLAVYDTAHRPYGLRLNAGAYVEGDFMLTPLFGLLGRAELRDARVWLGDAQSPMGGERLYITKGWRATGGVRFAVNEHVTVKAEYLHNGEYGGVPQIRDDVFTSSLVLAY
jgi:hypothetical protein